MRFCSTLSYRCEKDVEFKQMSHTEIARHEGKLGSICIILGLSLKTALVREEIVRYEVICTVCNAKFSFYQLFIIIHGKVLVSNFGPSTEI